MTSSTISTCLDAICWFGSWLQSGRRPITDLLLIKRACYRGLSSWRKGFKEAWRKLEGTLISMPINDANQPKVEEWGCTCPAFAVSRLLVCKHLVQQMHKAPPIFFFEAKRLHKLPFWRHKTLRPLEEYHDDSAAVTTS